jgi:hypothetical protein
MNLRRVVPYVVPVLALGGLLGGQSAAAGAGHPRLAQPATPVIGHLAYVTKSDAVKITAVAATGATSSTSTIGPVTKPTSKLKVQVSDLVASGDGSWVAWQETATKRGKPNFFRSVIALREVAGTHTLRLTTDRAVVGFSGDALIATNGVTSAWLSLTPTPHFVKIHDSQFPIGAAPQGVVDVATAQAPPGPRRTDRLRLTNFAGQHTVLHSYVLGSRDYRDPDAAWSSGDDKHLVVERGNHQDFGGLGPSSLADEFSLGGSLGRHQLGHFGSAKAQWRLASVSFAGASDQVWVVWSRATRTGATSVIARYRNGKWHSALSGGIAVAGNADGYVLAQAGKWVPAGGDADGFTTVPTGDPVLLHAGKTSVVAAKGSTFVWVS